MAVKAKVFGARLLIKRVEKEEKIGSIYLPEKYAEENRPRMGTVVAVGNGALAADGKTRVPMNVKVGDKVVYRELAGVPIEVDGEEYWVINEADVLAVIEE